MINIGGELGFEKIEIGWVDGILGVMASEYYGAINLDIAKVLRDFLDEAIEKNDIVFERFLKEAT